MAGRAVAMWTAMVIAMAALASPALASTVTGAGVDNSQPTKAAGARTQYVVTFTTTTAIAAGTANAITVNFQAGEGFGGFANGFIYDGTTAIGSCATPTAGAPVSRCSLYGGQSIAAAKLVKVVFGGITNPSQNGTLSVFTATDTSPAAVAVTVDPGHAVGGFSVTNATPTQAAGARTQFALSFTTSATGGLSQAANSRIDVTFAPGTTFTGFSNGFVYDGTTAVGSCSTPDATALTSECSLYGSVIVGPNHALQVVYSGVSNPTTPGTNNVMSLSTTSDGGGSAAFTVVAAGSVGSVVLSGSDPTAAAAGRTQYVVTFQTSGTGGLSQGANSRISISFPSTVGFTGFTNAFVYSGTTAIGSCSTPAGSASSCTLYGGQAVAPGATVKLVFSGVTNPTAASATPSVNVSTTSDGGATSNTIALLTKQAVTGVGWDNTAPSAAAGAQTQYALTFTTSSGGGLSQAANSQISVTFPSGTTFQGFTNGFVYDGSTAVGSCSTPAVGASTCTLYGGEALAPSHVVRVVFSGITNPSVVSSFTSSVTTTSDNGGSSSFSTVTGHAVSGVSLVNADPTDAAGARTQYALAFTTSATGGLSQAANSRINVSFPAGATFEGFANGFVYDGATAIGSCNTPSGSASACSLYGGVTVAPSHALRVVFSGVTNPSSPSGANTASVTTTSDLPVVASAPFAVTAAHQVGGVALQVGDPTPSVATPYTITYTTSPSGGLSQAANSRITLTFPAGTGFASLATGFVYRGTTAIGSCNDTAALTVQCTLYGSVSIAGGDAVRIALNNVTNPPSGAPTVQVATTSDPQAAGPGGPVVTPTPTATATAAPTATPVVVATAVPAQVTPTPTSTPVPPPPPTYHASVVVVPQGTVTLKRPGSSGFVTLAAGANIPLGSIVDTKQGSVRLTSVPKPGAAPQTAVFSQGIFKVTQTGNLTDLTLVEPLAPCPRGSASAAAKKPKSRRLWGDGSGSFRTRGHYSAATVRGTNWLVEDSCKGTLTKVRRGVVAVRDEVKQRTILLKAGKQYLAKP